MDEARNFFLDINMQSIDFLRPQGVPFDEVWFQEVFESCQEEDCITKDAVFPACLKKAQTLGFVSSWVIL